MRMRHIFMAALVIGSAPAFAYIGPGVGTGIIATVIGVISAFVLAVAGVVYYPIKRFIKSRKARRSSPDGGPPRS